MFRVFSNPYEGDFKELATKMTLRSFFKTIEICDEAVGKQLISSEINELDTTDGSSPTALWRPEIGFVRMAAREGYGRDDLDWYRANILSALFFAGVIQELDIKCHVTRPLTIGGKTISERKIHISGCKSNLKIFDSNCKLINSFELLHNLKPSIVWLDTLRQKEYDGSVMLSDGAWFRHWGANEDASIRLASDTDAYVGFFMGIMNVIKEASPTYFEWIDLLLTEIVPLRRIQNKIDHASSLFCPGQIRMTEPSLKLLPKVSRALAHEGSHQYFHMLMWNTVLCDSSAPDAYSSLKNSNRSLNLLLLGHHACGNELLLLSDLINSGLASEDFLSERSLVKTRFISLSKSIDSYSKHHISEIGISLVDSLNKRVKEKSLLL